MSNFAATRRIGTGRALEGNHLPTELGLDRVRCDSSQSARAPRAPRARSVRERLTMVGCVVVFAVLMLAMFFGLGLFASWMRVWIR
jgi:hypothetical protein